MARGTRNGLPVREGTDGVAACGKCGDDDEGGDETGGAHGGSPLRKLKARKA
jgi:hypothetical protein